LLTRHVGTQVKKTMKAIKHALTERFYAWEDAVEVAKEDPEVDLSGEGPAFTPREYLEEEATAEEGRETAHKGLSEAEIDPATLPSSTKPTASEPRV
jgi:large subunit ribosomal protein L47